MNPRNFLSVRREGFSLLEMVVSLFILGMFLFIFIQLEFLVERQNQALTTVSKEPSRTFQILVSIMHDIHRAGKAAPHGPNGVMLDTGREKITWMSVNGVIVRRVDGKKMFEVTSHLLHFQFNGDRTITVESEDLDLHITALVGGV